MDVIALRRQQGRREAVVAHGAMAGMAVIGVAVPDDADVSADVTLEAVDGGIIVKGSVRAPWSGECRRCLSPIAGETRAPVEEIFVDDPIEGDTWPIEHNRIDLEPIAREAIVLDLPLAPLCRSDCSGLCPKCGANRNEGDCGCPD